MINNNPQYYFKPTIPKYNYNDDKNIVDNKNPNNKTNKNKLKNALLGSLVALSAISIPAIEMLDKPNVETNNYYTTYTPSQDTEIMCNPELIAKGGKNDSLVEISEFLNLLNFSAMEKLPPQKQKTIKMIASANYIPVNICDNNAKEKITEQIVRIQNIVDKTIENNINNPTKSHYQKMLEHKLNYITSEEIIDNVDFSEILKYQKDISVLKAILRNSVQLIPRNDYNAYHKREKAINDAQNFVNNQVEQYKKYSKIAGNTDYNNYLSKKELINLLNLQSLEGIDKLTQKAIISKAIETYTPITFDNIQDDNKIKEKNQLIGTEVQKAQEIIDSEALNYKLQELEE